MDYRLRERNKKLKKSAIYLQLSWKNRESYDERIAHSPLLNKLEFLTLLVFMPFVTCNQSKYCTYCKERPYEPLFCITVPK